MNSETTGNDFEDLLSRLEEEYDGDSIEITPEERKQLVEADVNSQDMPSWAGASLDHDPVTYELFRIERDSEPLFVQVSSHTTQDGGVIEVNEIGTIDYDVHTPSLEALDEKIDVDLSDEHLEALQEHWEESARLALERAIADSIECYLAATRSKIYHHQKYPGGWFEDTDSYVNADFSEYSDEEMREIESGLTHVQWGMKTKFSGRPEYFFSADYTLDGDAV